MSSHAPLIGPKTRTVLLVPTHIALLAVLVVPMVPLDLRVAGVLVTIELALLGESIRQRFQGQSITISLGGGGDQREGD